VGTQRIPFHADLSIPADTGSDSAGSYTVFDPQSAEVIVKHIRISSLVAQRIVVGTADALGQRMSAGFLPAGGSGIRDDVDIDTGATSMLGQPIQVFTSEAGDVEIGIDGCTVVNTP
jgi:hypothetical protein